MKLSSQVTDTDACNRGCRFYTLSELINGGDVAHGSDANSLKKVCEHGNNMTKLCAINYCTPYSFASHCIVLLC